MKKRVYEEENSWLSKFVQEEESKGRREQMKKQVAVLKRANKQMKKFEEAA